MADVITSVQRPLSAKYSNFSIESLLRLNQLDNKETVLGPSAVNVLLETASHIVDPDQSTGTGLSSNVTRDRKIGLVAPSRQAVAVSCVQETPFRHNTLVAEGKVTALLSVPGRDTQQILGVQVTVRFVLKRSFLWFFHRKIRQEKRRNNFP
jgi:hypothetical protein